MVARTTVLVGRQSRPPRDAMRRIFVSQNCRLRPRKRAHPSLEQLPTTHDTTKTTTTTMPTSATATRREAASSACRRTTTMRPEQRHRLRPASCVLRSSLASPGSMAYNLSGPSLGKPTTSHRRGWRQITGRRARRQALPRRDLRCAPGPHFAVGC